MSFRFRFPIALLHYLDEDKSNFGFTNTVEKAREFALPEQGKKKARPTLKEAEAYINELVKARQEEKDDRMQKKDY